MLTLNFSFVSRHDWRVVQGRDTVMARSAAVVFSTRIRVSIV
jgi:hypothetical protein